MMAPMMALPLHAAAAPACLRNAKTLSYCDLLPGTPKCLWVMCRPPGLHGPPCCSAARDRGSHQAGQDGSRLDFAGVDIAVTALPIMLQASRHICSAREAWWRSYGSS